MTGRQVWRYKSTGRARALVLLALGVVRVATAGQLRQLVLPGTADEQTVRNACKDLRDAGLTESAGRAWRPGRNGAPVAQDLWSLTPAGQAAAATELERPVEEMGATGRAAAQAGAAHQLAVTDVIDVIRQSPPLPTKPVPRRTTGPGPRRELPVRPRGIGHLRGWTTDVALPGAGHLRADAVLTAPEDDVPVLFVEVDHHGEPPAAVAAKIAAYRDAFRLRVTDPHSQTAVPLWSTRWPAPGTGHPPLALVFAKDVPPPVLARRIDAIRDASRSCWQPPAALDTWPDESDTVPLVTTTLALLREHGPHGPVWTRFGPAQSLADALAHPAATPAARVPDQGHRRRDEQGEDVGDDQEQAGPSVWACPSCGGATAPGMPSGLDGYRPAVHGRCPRCEQVHRDLAQKRAQTGVLARLRSRSDATAPAPGPAAGR
ncbi:replication-relaxation family protein [Streptomyces sp. t39]|uniref:replication-relaxation family protein n=1 Tax=Streptomyces sp. t39 TaxID=1828156 RepID=UPI0011CD8C7C|nr:replication-relaxation family protein [Streptomyces sp. t39]TXS35239.1 hypothetical protein EAO77_37325 [Streptomyces sp. t39]